MTKRIVIALIVLAGTMAAEAQQLPPGKWWQRPELAQRLELTRDQQDRLDAIFRASANELIDAKAEVDKLHVALRGEIDRPQLQRQDVQRVAAQLNVARGRLFERELMMLVDMHGVLNQEQWNRLRTHLDRMQDRGRGPRAPERKRPARRRPPQ